MVELSESPDRWLAPQHAKEILRAQELGDLTPNKHVIALRFIDAGFLATDGWRYMSVEEARECWRVCHKKI